MTITRADVESFLAHAIDTEQVFQAELARTWLAVDDAPSGETVSCIGFDTYRVTFETAPYIPAGTYKLVCIETPKD